MAKNVVRDIGRMTYSLLVLMFEHYYKLNEQDNMTVYKAFLVGTLPFQLGTIRSNKGIWNDPFQ